MHEQDESRDQAKKLSELLKQSFPPVPAEPSHDLWPKMRRRLDEETFEPRGRWAWFSALNLSSVPWFDWALLAALTIGVCVFPKSIPIWLYHF